MPHESSKSEMPELDAEFSRLFWAVRREHNRLKKNATNHDPAYTSAVAFAKSQEWKWAEDLIEASRLQCTGDHEMSLKMLVECEVCVSNQHRSLVLFLRGTALATKGEWDEAIKAFREAINTPGCDNLGGVWNNLGGAFAAKAEWDQAIKAVSQALNTPGYDTPAGAWNNLGNALAAKGELDEAIKAYRKALEIPGEDNVGGRWYALGTRLQAKGDQEEAVNAYRKALETPGYEDLGLAWHGLAMALQAGGKLDEAIKAYRNALNSSGFAYAGHAWHNLGTALQAKGDLEEAVNAYRKALDTPGCDCLGRAWQSLGTALKAKGELDQAIKAYRQALDTPGFDYPAYAWHALGYALQAKGELNQAIEAYHKAINIPGYDHLGRAWYDVATALQARGELDQAIEIYRKALDLPTSNYRISAWLKLGTAFHAKGDWDQAMKAWKKATETRGSDDPAQSDDHSRPLAPFNMENFEVPRNVVGTESRQAGISSPSFSRAATRSSGPMPNESLDSFTPRAQQVLALAREEAARLNHNFAGTEHVLLGIISLGQGVAANVLVKLGIDLANVREAVEKGVGTGPDQRVTRDPAFTPRVKKAMALAVEEAKTMNHAYVGTEHILLGLLRKGDGVAARVLKDLGVDIEKTRLEILKELDPNFRSPGDES